MCCLFSGGMYVSFGISPIFYVRIGALRRTFVTLLLLCDLAATSAILLPIKVGLLFSKKTFYLLQ